MLCSDVTERVCMTRLSLSDTRNLGSPCSLNAAAPSQRSEQTPQHPCHSSKEQNAPSCLRSASNEIHLNWSKTAASSLWVQKVTAAASCSCFSCLSSQNSSHPLQAPINVLFLRRDTAPTDMNTSRFVDTDNTFACFAC